ncbi:ribokinase [Bifidobacterium aquikefiricola]|uniref:Ribokinase n=1 Tax=Bifidobacterium aquikefiricola TaxID=3059038 RepID=A0AB39U5X9_9BIFI
MNETFDIRKAFEKISSSSRTIAVLGSMNADYTVETETLPRPGETVFGGPLQILAGGKSANQASAAARIGAQVKLLGALGTDENADFLFSTLAKAGVSMGSIARMEGKSGTTVITVDAHAENTIVYSAGSNAKVTPDYVRSVRGTIQGAAVLGVCFESPMDSVIEAASIAHQSGVKVLLNNSPFRQELPAEIIANIDILLVNEHEISHMLHLSPPPGDDWAELDWDVVTQRLHSLGCNQAVVTLGSQGAYVLDINGFDENCGHFWKFLKAVEVKAVDTTGCGDAFMGAILAGLTAGLSLYDSARLAVYVAGYAATGLGAQSSYGTSRQIVDLLSS